MPDSFYESSNKNLKNRKNQSISYQNQTHLDLNLDLIPNRGAIIPFDLQQSIKKVKEIQEIKPSHPSLHNIDEQNEPSQHQIPTSTLKQYL